MTRFRALTLDLDDTLWPFAPIGARIEQALHRWMLEHSPRTAQRFGIAQMRALREQVHAEHPQHEHDLGLLRRLTIERALHESGGDVALADAAYAIFFRERNRVDFFPDALPALRRIAARLPVVALTNGNADLAAIGIEHLFVACINARTQGVGKPDPRIFAAACAAAGCRPGEAVHAGDDPDSDVRGARDAGLRACWIDRTGAPWPQTAGPAPDLVCRDLAALADWLDAATPQERDAA